MEYKGFSQEVWQYWQIMANYEEDTQLSKLKSIAQNKTGTILIINKKRFQCEELPHELFLTARKTSKIRNAIATNMSMDIKLCKAQLSKMIQSGGYLRNMLGNLDKKK